MLLANKLTAFVLLLIN